MRSLCLTAVLWFGIPPVIQHSNQQNIAEEKPKPLHDREGRWATHAAPDFYILEMYFDSLLEYSLDDIEEHSVTLPPEALDPQVDDPKDL